MKFKIYLLFTFFILSHSVVLGQITISGKILDSLSNEFLIGTTIQVDNSNIRTITNEEGDFEVKPANFPLTLIISHIGYKKIQITVKENEFLRILLVPEAISLPEVKTGNPAIAILNSMINKAKLFKNEEKVYKAFYRRISTNDGEVNRIQEMFANVSWNIYGIKEWQPISIRYAEVNPLPSRNLYFLSFLHSAIVHDKDGFPINTVEIGNNYTFKVAKYFNVGKANEIAVISYLSNDQNRGGEIYINTQKDLLIKIKEYQAINMQHNFKKRLEFEANFKENGAGEVIFDNILVTETTGKKIDIRKANERIWLYFQDKVSGFEESKIYPSFLKSDQKVFLSVPYNMDFWQKNVPFSATEPIRKIIKKMEQSDKFNSNFN